MLHLKHFSHSVRQPYPGRILQMPVDIPGRADVRVSQPVADFLKLEALGEQQAGAGVAQIVEPDIRQIVTLDETPLNSESLGYQWCFSI